MLKSRTLIIVHTSCPVYTLKLVIFRLLPCNIISILKLLGAKKTVDQYVFYLIRYIMFDVRTINNTDIV